MGWNQREDGGLISVVISRDAQIVERLMTVMGGMGDVKLADAAEKVALVSRANHVDLAVWDVASMAIDRLSPEVPILGLGPNDPEQMLAALEAGAQGYLDVESSTEEIQAAAEQVASGSAVVSPLLLGPLLRAVVDRRRRERHARAALHALTPRERQVFDLAAKGFSKSEVARTLVISPDTARTHLQKLMAKLDLHSQAEIVAFAASCGLPTETEGSS